jgi:hypothetical protein
MVGWLVGWMDGWMDGWLDGQIVAATVVSMKDLKRNHFFLR